MGRQVLSAKDTEPLPPPPLPPPRKENLFILGGVGDEFEDCRDFMLDVEALQYAMS